MEGEEYLSRILEIVQVRSLQIIRNMLNDRLLNLSSCIIKLVTLRRL